MGAQAVAEREEHTMQGREDYDFPNAKVGTLSIILIICVNAFFMVAGVLALGG